MACMFTHAVRGDQSLILKQYSKADENTKIVYLDTNNLYGFGMSGKLPVDDFRWEFEVLIKRAMADPLAYLEELDKSGRGCFVMGDFHIPGEIHKLMHDYPFMPENSCVPEAALSDKQRELNANNRTKHNPRQEYLLQTMWDKTGYVVYGEMLDFYLQHGVQMTHIYCIITFRVANWLKLYIELNTKLRNEAKRTGNALRITVFKGMNNFIYGKFLQNVFKQMNLKFLNTIEDAIRTQSLPGFVRNTFHNGNFTIADVLHEKVQCDKPIYLGAAITELVKLHMYHFFYDQVIPFWKRENVELLMTDTDSLMLEIKMKDLWGDIDKLNMYFGNWIEQEGNE